MSSNFELKEVNVRMYRPGLGDCFLLKFIGASGERRNILIDCGVYQGTAGGSDRLKKIVQSIKQETGGDKDTPGQIHILVATHDHADHLAGFMVCEDIFKKEFVIDEVWMPWTEDKDDPKVAQMFGTIYGTPLEALKTAAEELKKANNPYHQYLKNVLQFVAERQMDIVKTFRLDPKYLRPAAGEDGPTTVFVREDFGGVCFHVLGPPEDTQSLVQTDPPKDKNQIYRGEPLNQATAFTIAVQKISNADKAIQDDPALMDVEEIYKLTLPFDPRRAIPIEQAKKNKDPFFSKYYGFSDQPGQGEAWRRIDSDWLEAAAELALNLDNDTNNTSLVLAIELAPGGKVLLFAADAQAGNWSSWAPTARGTDLLKRTVLYKVGHHGSHNATLKKGGLDQMVNPDLVAMIPVDTAKAHNLKPHPFMMPDSLLENLLLNQTRGRIMIVSEGESPTEECSTFPFNLPVQKPASILQEKWDQWINSPEYLQFKQAITWDDSEDKLWIEYKLPV
jgi:beta-lactamase superfamily II metal-dependent hydrolase